MVYLYHATRSDGWEPLKEGTIKIITMCMEDRKYLTRWDYARYFITGGRFRKVIVLDSDGTIMHISRMMGVCYKFPFLKKTSVEIGPCVTYPNFRGRGIYPAVLRYIRSTDWYKDYFLLIDKENTASIRGAEKAGFTLVGSVIKRRGQWIINDLR